MKMLLLKAWTETRVRFFSSLLAATVVCLYHITQHAWLVTLWKQTLATDPKALTHFPWMPLGISSYDWYLWHYLFDNYLQQLWRAKSSMAPRPSASDCPSAAGDGC
jgi:hypothetical protein